MRAVRLSLVALVLVASSIALATGAGRPGGLSEEAPAPDVVDPLPFSHKLHDAAFDKAGLACVNCHPIGARTETGAVPLPPVPLSSCHGCHLSTFPGAPKKADPTCGNCHPDRRQLMPRNHGLEWVISHGPEARSAMKECTACHTRDGCVDCHEGRGALVQTPHAPGFRSTHGVEAHLDSASCSSCHVETSCTACHSTGVKPW